MINEEDEIEDFELNETCPVYKLVINGYDETDTLVFEHLVGEFQYINFAIEGADVLMENVDTLRDSFAIDNTVKKIEIAINTTINDETIETVYNKTI